MFSRAVLRSAAITPPCLPSSSPAFRPLSSFVFNCSRSKPSLPQFSLRSFHQSSATMSNTKAFFDVEYAPQGTGAREFSFLFFLPISLSLFFRPGGGWKIYPSISLTGVPFLFCLLVDIHLRPQDHYCANHGYCVL